MAVTEATFAPVTACLSGWRTATFNSAASSRATDYDSTTPGVVKRAVVVHHQAMQAFPQVTKLRCVHGQELSKLATQLQHTDSTPRRMETACVMACAALVKEWARVCACVCACVCARVCTHPSQQ
jgi:hypothetical protein